VIFRDISTSRCGYLPMELEGLRSSAAIGQAPAAHRRKLLIRVDGAGTSHDLPTGSPPSTPKRGHPVEYSVGYAVTDKIRGAIPKVPKDGVEARDHRSG